MDDLAWSIYEYLLDESTDFQGKHIVLLPITVIARKFDRNHRTVSRRLSALRDEGLILYRRMLEAGVTATSHTVNGTCHAGDLCWTKDLPDVWNATIDAIHSFAK